MSVTFPKASEMETLIGSFSYENRPIVDFNIQNKPSLSYEAANKLGENIFFYPMNLKYPKFKLINCLSTSGRCLFTHYHQVQFVEWPEKAPYPNCEIVS